MCSCVIISRLCVRHRLLMIRLRIIFLVIVIV
ncbi:hypothetical protein [Escherichia phage pEC-M2929-1AR.1]|nr:hypothetical protein [Escherichia phage pEC-M2929-1AR.1]